MKTPEKKRSFELMAAYHDWLNNKTIPKKTLLLDIIVIVILLIICFVIVLNIN